MKVRAWKKIFHAKIKKVGLTIFISDKINFKAKATKIEDTI